MGPALLLLCVCTTCVSGAVLRTEGGARSSRSDDTSLQTVVETLTQDLIALKASHAAQQKQIADLMSRHCESGTVSVRPEAQSNREETKHITFSRPFSTTPAVTAGIIHFDSDSSGATAVRLDVQVRNVAPGGFDLVAREWLDSHNHGSDLSWMACSS